MRFRTQNEFLVAVLWHAIANHFSVQQAQGSE
jgi:hypothetical protein